MTHPRSEEFDKQQSSYWLFEQAHDYVPHCRVAASDASDVSAFINAISDTQTPFAVRSGGHSFLPGASNIDRGVTLDLSNLNKIELSEDKKTVLLQPAARWIDVYRALEQHTLSVTGGRAPSVGVGGYVLGGGSSWNSNRYGWSCDSVLEFEVVLVNGSIIKASAGSHSDIYWALKGGGNNFGIVTGMRMSTFHQGDYLVVMRGYVKQTMPHVFSAFATFTREASNDPDAIGAMSFYYTAESRSIEGGMVLINTAGERHSPSFRCFDHLQPLRESTLVGNSSTVALLGDQDSDLKYRKLKFTLTFHPDGALMERIFNMFDSLTGSVAFEDATTVGLTFQPLTATHLSRSNNALGLSAAGPLILLSFEIYWTRKDETGFFEKFTEGVHDKVRTLADEMGMLHPFVYLNYAAKWQDPFIGYGAENLQRLRSVQEKYDPEGVLSILQPGGKKLNANTANNGG